MALALSIAIAFIIVTFLHVILGEQAPKMLAIARAEPIAAAGLPAAASSSAARCTR